MDACRPWSYSEWTENIDRNLTPEQIRRITQPSVMEWMEQTMVLCEDIYANTPSGGNYSYDYSFQYAPAVKQQFLQAGLRLARLLEEIYGNGRAECTGQEAFFCPTLGWIRVGVNERKNI